MPVPAARRCSPGRATVNGSPGCPRYRPGGLHLGGARPPAVGGRADGLADRGAAFHPEGATSVRHHRSRTSSAEVERVLPVVVWSALLYLDKWECRRTRGKLLIALALVLRVLLVPWSRAPVGAHLRGIRASVHTLLRDAEPPLPPFG